MGGADGSPAAQRQGVNQGSGGTLVQSSVVRVRAAGHERRAAGLRRRVTTGCIHAQRRASADLKYVGTTSDAPASSIGDNPQDPNADGQYGLSTSPSRRRARGAPRRPQEFDVYIDTTGDGEPDFVAYNTRLHGTDVLVTELVDLTARRVIDDELINDRLGDTDTALFDSDTMVLPLWPVPSTV